MKSNEKNFLKFSPSQKQFSTEVFSERQIRDKTDKIDIKFERAVWRAVIMQMILNSTSGSKKLDARKLKESSLAWFNLENPNFLEVCENAGYSPHYVLRKANFAITNCDDWKKNCRDRHFRPTKKELAMRTLLKDDLDFEDFYKC